MKSFKDKVIVITGAGSGIGRALALAFHKEGARLGLNDISDTALRETITLMADDNRVLTRVFDVSDKESMYDFARGVIDYFGRVDVVINNAGVAIAALRADEVSIEDYEWILGINLWGMIYGSLAFLPYLRKQKQSSLVNISSIFGVHGIPRQAPYCTTKFGIRGFTESLALEEQINKTGVVVTSVHPGGIKTHIARNSRHSLDSEEEMAKFEKAFITSPQRAAEVILAGIRRKKMRVLVGSDAKAFYLLTKLPHWIIVRYLKKWARQMS